MSNIGDIQIIDPDDERPVVYPYIIAKCAKRVSREGKIVKCGNLLSRYNSYTICNHCQMRIKETASFRYAGLVYQDKLKDDDRPKKIGIYLQLELDKYKRKSIIKRKVATDVLDF